MGHRGNITGFLSCFCPSVWFFWWCVLSTMLQNTKKIPLPHYLLLQWTGCHSDCELRGGGRVEEHKAFFLFSFFGCCSISTISNRPRSHFGSCEQVCIFSVFLPPPPSMSGVEMYFGKLKRNTLNAGYIYSAASVRVEQKPRRWFLWTSRDDSRTFGRVWFCCVSPAAAERSNTVSLSIS